MVTNRFEEIKARLARHQTSDYADAHYLLAEVERLRKIEEAARDLADSHQVDWEDKMLPLIGLIRGDR